MSFTDNTAEIYKVFIGNVDVTRKGGKNRHIRNDISCSGPPDAKILVTHCGRLNMGKLLFINTILTYKYVSLKILHQMCPDKDTLEDLK